jgi:2-polyprenyl-3-methyl-5-hydroxy-6-metoxy-1,4-benzoquinol methylase
MRALPNPLRRIGKKRFKEYDEDRREHLAKKYIKGRGVEIGALHKPVKTNKGVVVKYVDYKSTKENRARYPELAEERIVETDIVDNGFFLKKIKNHSLDFVIANHFLEHSPDPIGTLYTLQKKLKPGGLLFMAVPILDKNYDFGRQLTTFRHLAKDHRMFKNAHNNFDAIIAESRKHLVGFLQISDGNIRKQMGMKPKFSNIRKAEKEADKILTGFRERMKEIQIENQKSLKAKPLRKARISSSEKEKLYEDVMNAHIYKLNIIYDIHYHTFSPSSYRRFFKYLRWYSRGKFKLQEVSISGSGEVIAVAKNAA